MARRGRPTKQAKPGTKASLGLKVTAEVKAVLEQEAAKSGRTQSQEAEYRLERSFERQQLLQEVLETAYGPKIAALTVAIAEAARGAMASTNFVYHTYDTGVQNDRDLRDPWVYSEVTAAITDVLYKFSPDELPKPPPEWVEKQVSTGKKASISTLDALLNGHWPHLQWVTTVLVGLLRAKEWLAQQQPEGESP